MHHIALVTTSYPDGKPGTEAAGSFVADFAEELSQRVRVTVVAAGTEDETSEIGNLCIRRFAVPRLPLSLLKPTNPRHWGALITTMKAGLNAVERLAAEDKPDHLLALWVLPSGYWAQRAAKRYGFGYSVWALGSDVWTLARIPVVRSVFKNVAINATRRFADGVELGNEVTSVSGADCRFLPSTRRLPAVKGKRLVTEPPYKLAFLGRWHPNKGTDLLLDALQQLDDESWRKMSEVRIFGGGPQESSVSQAVASLESQSRPITVGGYLDKQDAADLIGWSDYLLLPSRIESIPVIFSDAMQVGTPLIATPVGDLPQLHQKYNFGVVARNISSSAFAEAIATGLAGSPDSYSQGIALARTDFDLARIVDHFLQEAELDVQ
jgi:glycosyltransferase involved in cell wall biosynthesis